MTRKISIGDGEALGRISLREYRRQYYQNNAEKLREYNRQYYQDNIEELREYKRQYRLRKKSRLDGDGTGNAI